MIVSHRFGCIRPSSRRTFQHGRHYIASLERRFLPIANTAAATYINEELRIGHGHLSSLISIQKDFFADSDYIEAAGDVLTELNALVSLDLTNQNSLEKLGRIFSGKAGDLGLHSDIISSACR